MPPCAPGICGCSASAASAGAAEVGVAAVAGAVDELGMEAVGGVDVGWLQPTTTKVPMARRDEATARDRSERDMFCIRD